MNSLEIVNKLYKPYRITKKGSTTIIDSMDGSFAIKPKGEKSIKDLFDYLEYRTFSYYPNLVDESRSDVNIYEYIEDAKIPKDQKGVDLARVLAQLHSRTSYKKEVREDKYKAIYEQIKSNLLYYKDEYSKMILEIENHIFMSPSEYLFIRNSSKLLSQIAFCQDKLDDWYELVKDKRETRVSIVHGNVEMDHFIKGKKEALISWDKWSFDSPILDMYNFYSKEALNLEFSSILKEYLKNCPLEEEERQLLFILLCLPRDFSFIDDEFASCVSIGESLDYVFKTEYLVRPYYTEKDVE